MPGQKTRRPAGNRKGGTAKRAPFYFAYVGSFTTEKRRARGDGIHAYRMNSESGAWSHIQHVGDLVNPSWLFTNRARTVLYVLHGDQDYATTFRIDRATGMLSPLNRATTGGVNGVSGKLDASEKFLILANYGNGKLAVMPVAEDGSLGEPVQVYDIPGEPHPHHRTYHQESSRPHDIVFDPSGRFIVVPDKGLDKVFVFSFDPKQGRLSPTAPDPVRARACSGPRHVAFHPTQPVAWILNELDSTLTTYRWNAKRGTLTTIDIASTLPGSFVADNLSSEIAYRSKSNTLYVSNRGHDSIAIFRLDRTSHAPKSVSWQPTRGEKPRFFAFDPTDRFLYVANETGDTITRFAVDGRTGGLEPLRGTIKTGSPVTIAFVEQDAHG